jgi:hypothetical protein
MITISYTALLILWFIAAFVIALTLGAAVMSVPVVGVIICLPYVVVGVVMFLLKSMLTSVVYFFKKDK